VPPALNRFTKAVDRNLAETIFKLLLKYKPEERAAKKERLLKEAEARAAGKSTDKKRPVCIPACHN
jgi:large subunit ribosomal protein L7Ae